MFKRSFLICLLICTAANAEIYRRGDWIASGGMGFTTDPGTFLVAPQVEYVYKPNLFFGPLVQMGFANGTLFTTSAAARLVFGRHPRLKPNLEGGLGISASSGLFNKSIGLHLHFGVGFDYLLSRDLSVGTVFRANFAPPMKGFFLSWPLLTLRLLL